MEATIHRFVRLLRLSGVPVSVSETIDATRAAAQPGMLGERDTLREALRMTLIKDRRYDAVFDELFTAFFTLTPPSPAEQGNGHHHGHDDLSDTGAATSFTLSEEPSHLPQPGHSHGPPRDIRDYFDPQDLAQRYNPHQEASKIDLSALTQEIVLPQDRQRSTAGSTFVGSVELAAERLHNPGTPGRLSRGDPLRADTEMTVAGPANGRSAEESDGPEPATPRGRAQAADALAELLLRHLAKLAQLAAAVESRAVERARTEAVDEQSRRELEASLRRLARTLSGALTATRRNSPRGRAHPARTMRQNMRYDAVPFRPVTTTRAEDAPRLVVLADVSLSVRASARFTLHLVHTLQSLFGQVRSFAFVDEPHEITELFAEHPLQQVADLVFGAVGGLLDVDADSDYGRTFELMLAEHRSALTRKTTLLMLGDGRGNGHDPKLEAFEELTRRARQTIWLTPEPRYSWRLGSCDLPAYAEHCDQIHVVPDLARLEGVAHQVAQRFTGR
ncbi:VWA domain-containing protein [Nonomuraea sp. SYSU D8015]|uniref:VWA domain-containing protein n=1 Tax=Nonomuraea sp. SYSU D8015 TaxID=2593644 RepID=UPI0016600937|nr:VWA domain-containing protein [Nonomuraea sp. SYSU D8015]